MNKYLKKNTIMLYSVFHGSIWKLGYNKNITIAASRDVPWPSKIGKCWATQS